MSSAKKRNYLTLKKKVEVIKTLQKNPGMKLCTLAGLFDCGKTQITNNIKKKEPISSMCEGNLSANTIHDSKMFRTAQYAEVNKALYEWYTLACSKNIYPGGPQLAE